MKFKRLSYKTEPTLKVHRHIVTISRDRNGTWSTQYAYCMNLKEVREAKAQALKGDVIEVFSADHNFKNAWQRVD